MKHILIGFCIILTSLCLMGFTEQNILVSILIKNENIKFDRIYQDYYFSDEIKLLHKAKLSLKQEEFKQKREEYIKQQQEIVRQKVEREKLEQEKQQQIQKHNQTIQEQKDSITSQQSPSQKSTYAKSSIYFNGKVAPYVYGGNDVNHVQRIIDGGIASTYITPNFSGTDGLNTFFAGHNRGIFTGIWTAPYFIVTDANGKAFKYNTTKVFKIYNQINKNWTGVDDGVNYVGEITGTSGGERITLQTCYNADGSIDWIVEASFAGEL